MTTWTGLMCLVHAEAEEWKQKNWERTQLAGLFFVTAQACFYSHHNDFSVTWIPLRICKRLLLLLIKGLLWELGGKEVGGGGRLWFHRGTVDPKLQHNHGAFSDWKMYHVSCKCEKSVSIAVLRITSQTISCDRRNFFAIHGIFFYYYFFKLTRLYFL